MSKFLILISLILFSCNYKTSPEETTEKVVGNNNSEDSFIEDSNIHLYQKGDFEKFGKAFLSLIGKKQTNKLKECILDTLVYRYEKINSDSFISKMYTSPFDSLLLKNIKDNQDIRYTKRTFNQDHPVTRADIEDAYNSYEIALFNPSSEKHTYMLTLLMFYYTKKGFLLYEYSVQPTN